MKMTSFSNKIKTMIAIGAMMALSMGCANVNTSDNHTAKGEQTITGNGIYYWKTKFKLSEKEKEFLKKHDIKRLYIKLFDVDFDIDFNGTPRSIPIATTQFIDSVPQDIEIVPVVYITDYSITNDPNIDSLLYDRIRAMGKRNGFDGMKEIQLDCDWTNDSRSNFFRLCHKMRKWAHHDSIQVSATIRLHQLRDSVPPVDHGVLMMYNTGSLYNPQTRNSILDERDVEPYLKRDIHYDLPLSIAYPTYSWSIYISRGEFRNIVHRTTYEDTSYFKQIGKDLYRVKKWHHDKGHFFDVDDTIRIERSETEQIARVKALLRSQLKNTPLSHIIYHLDEQELSHYTEKEIETILK